MDPHLLDLLPYRPTLPGPGHEGQKAQGGSILEKLDARRVTYADRPPEPVTVFWVAGQSISTGGNLTVISAQAKAGKTAVISAMIAATLAQSETLDFLGFTSAPDQSGSILVFDTEQSPYDAWTIQRRNPTRSDCRQESAARLRLVIVCHAQDPARLGEWSLMQGTRQARNLNKTGLKTTVSINVSRGQLADARFSQALQAAIILADIDPGLIELEFSESIFMDASEVIQTNLRTAREIGVNLAIDNFGTGFSCLANLKDIPATKLKLGGGFIKALAEDSRTFSVVKAVINMGKDLGMTVIAEGVETKEQLDSLKELSVDGVQGYYYARPMDVDGLSSWLTERVH